MFIYEVTAGVTGHEGIGGSCFNNTNALHGSVFDGLFGT